MNIGVIGTSKYDDKLYNQAEEVGKLIALKSAKLVCGGRSGVMEGAAKGASENNGETIGILPGLNKEDSNDFIKHSIVTGIGQARNLVVVLTSDCLIAVGGGFGTLSEIALALKHGIPVIALGSWELNKINNTKEINELFFVVFTPQEAVDKAYEMAQNKKKVKTIKE